MGMKQILTQETINKICTLYIEGHSYRTIAKMLNISKTTVERYVKLNNIKTRDKIQKRDSFGRFGERTDIPSRITNKKCNTLKTYRNIIKENSICSLCSASTNLVVHHIDRNRNNNSKENLQIVCDYCHRKVIHIRNRDTFGRFKKEELNWVHTT